MLRNIRRSFADLLEAVDGVVSRRQSVLFAVTLFRRADERDYAPAFEPSLADFNRRNHRLITRRIHSRLRQSRSLAAVTA